MGCILKKAIDLTGMRFGKLTVIGRNGTHITPCGSKKVIWKCLCDCGNYKDVAASSLRNGLTTSCGCYISEKISKIKKKYNDYKLTEKYGVGITSNNEEFYFDLDDYDKIKDYCWYIDKNGYVVNHSFDKPIYMHRLLMNPSDKLIVDHINHKKYDNRKENLRCVNYSQNNRNKYSLGVYYDKIHKKWVADIVTEQYKTKRLGYFDNKDDATKARKEAENIYYGEYSYDNSMKIGDVIGKNS